MATASLDNRIDELYQLPLDQFTAARNSLAKEAGPNGRDIKALQKPPIAAWAVNQLYWKRRKIYDTLIEAATTLRQSHKAVLSGKGADLRVASQEHEEALERALEATLDLLREAGQPATDSTRHAIHTTLRALPSDDPPGRLTRVLQPGGFEMLAGVPVRTPSRSTSKAATAKPSGGRAREEETGRDAPALARAREAATAAARDLKIAEHAARREEFEAARAAREHERAEKALASAREELEAAERAVREAERAVHDAKAKRDTARQRAEAAERALDKARTRLADAEGNLKALTKKSR